MVHCDHLERDNTQIGIQTTSGRLNHHCQSGLLSQGRLGSWIHAVDAKFCGPGYVSLVFKLLSFGELVSKTASDLYFSVTLLEPIVLCCYNPSVLWFQALCILR